MKSKVLTIPSVCILTAAWNQVEKTLACLETVFKLTYTQFDVVLVDNGSKDELREQVRQWYPQVEIIRSETNLGFAAGFNLGLRLAMIQGYDYIFLINNDTLLASDCLTMLVDGAQVRPNAALLTAKIYYASDPNRIWTVGGSSNKLLLEVKDVARGQLDVGQWETPSKIEFAPLCGVLLNTHCLSEVGLLDELFFLYYEDMEFCHRLRRMKYELWLMPQARMWHEVSASSGGSNTPTERYWMALSSGLYFRNSATWLQLVFIIPYRLASAIRTTIKLLKRRSYHAVYAYWLGLWNGWVKQESKHPILDSDV